MFPILWEISLTRKKQQQSPPDHNITEVDRRAHSATKKRKSSETLSVCEKFSIRREPKTVCGAKIAPKALTRRRRRGRRWRRRRRKTEKKRARTNRRIENWVNMIPVIVLILIGCSVDLVRTENNFNQHRRQQQQLKNITDIDYTPYYYECVIIALIFLQFRFYFFYLSRIAYFCGFPYIGAMSVCLSVVALRTHLVLSSNEARWPNETFLSTSQSEWSKRISGKRIRTHDGMHHCISHSNYI